MIDMSKNCQQSVPLADEKKRSEEYDALDLMMKVMEGLEDPVLSMPHRPDAGQIFVFSCEGNQHKKRNC